MLQRTAANLAKPGEEPIIYEQMDEARVEKVVKDHILQARLSVNTPMPEEWK